MELITYILGVIIGLFSIIVLFIIYVIIQTRSEKKKLYYYASKCLEDTYKIVEIVQGDYQNLEDFNADIKISSEMLNRDLDHYTYYNSMRKHEYKKHSKISELIRSTLQEELSPPFESKTKRVLLYTKLVYIINQLREKLPKKLIPEKFSKGLWIVKPLYPKLKEEYKNEPFNLTLGTALITAAISTILLTASSYVGWEDAIRKAIKTAKKKITGIRNISITGTDLSTDEKLENPEYKVKIQINFEEI